MKVKLRKSQNNRESKVTMHRAFHFLPSALVQLSDTDLNRGNERVPLERNVSDCGEAK